MSLLPEVEEAKYYCFEVELVSVIGEQLQFKTNPPEKQQKCLGKYFRTIMIYNDAAF